MQPHSFRFQAVAVALFAAGLPGNAIAQSFTVTNLDSDVPNAAANVDPQLVAPVGLARGILGPWWVSDSGSAVSTLYGGDGGKRGLVVNLPSPPGSAEPSRPTGTVFNGGGTDFNVSPGNPALFLFVTLEGTILGWPGADVFNAAILVDRHGDASYTGMTIAEVGKSHVLYAVDSKHGRIEGYDGHLNRIALDDDAFRDERLPRGMVPFNVQQVGPDVVVTYRPRVDGWAADEPRGWVAIFNARGRFLVRLERGEGLDQPWGVAMAPQDFGEFSHLLLVANHGSGEIAAFDPFTGKFAGRMLDSSGVPIRVDGLWAIVFGDGGIADFGSGPNTGPFNACYFTAAPSGGKHGLFGNILPVLAEQTHDEQ
jgi:uncharacterized protein (TIGR03118 family)